jgi:M6 family metalloprotease-like protein
MPTPFVGQVFAFTQPDGTALWVKGWGNQYHAVFEALNGYTLVKNPVTGFMEYAGGTLAPTGALPRVADPRKLGLTPGVRLAGAAARALAAQSPLVRGGARWETRRKKVAMRGVTAAGAPVLAPPQRHTVGDFLGLCLLIQFPDVAGTITQAEVANFCNQAGYQGFGNNGSVYDYFLDQSGAKLRYRNLVTPYYMARHERAYYTSETVAQPVRARELVDEALAHWRANGFDFSALTLDDDGYVYAANVLFAGPRVNRWGEGLWPHAHYLAAPAALPSGGKVYDYQITEIGAGLSLGTFCHENGHMICDFPDLYDYGNQSAGVGAFCLMCTGANADEKNPTAINAYLKYRAGWAASLTVIQPGLQASAQAQKNAFFIHRKNATEYFIIENRQQLGRDRALPANGLAIWHIDELGDNQNEHMTAALHYECALMQADGRNDLEHDFRAQGDAGDLFRAGANEHFGDATVPHSRWWDGTPSGLDLGAIGASAAAMRFDCTLAGATPAAAPAMPADPDERSAAVNTLVKEAIRSLCPPNTVVMRATLLGPAGLAHSTAKRMQYYTPIRDRLAERGARIPTLSPESFAAATLKTVGQVCDLVNGALVEGPA